MKHAQLKTVLLDLSIVVMRDYVRNNYFVHYIAAGGLCQ